MIYIYITYYKRNGSGPYCEKFKDYQSACDWVRNQDIDIVNIDNIEED